MHTTGNIVDDLPNDDLVVKDLSFEEELNGSPPFEIILNFNSVVYDNFQTLLEFNSYKNG